MIKENNEAMDEDFFTPVVYTDNDNATADSTATIVTTLVTGILKTVVDVTSCYQSPGNNTQSDDDAESEVSTDEGIVATDDDDENKYKYDNNFNKKQLSGIQSMDMENEI